MWTVSTMLYVSDREIHAQYLHMKLRGSEKAMSSSGVYMSTLTIIPISWATFVWDILQENDLQYTPGTTPKELQVS